VSDRYAAGSGRFWAADQAAQVEYELLRTAALAGEQPASLAAGRFARRGLAGLITCAWPAPAYQGVLLGAERPAWCGESDPRPAALAHTYELLLARTPAQALQALRG
jgi:hypothetical protein